METKTNTWHPETIAAIFIAGAVTLSGWLLGWTMAERMAVLAIIGFAALVTLKR